MCGLRVRVVSYFILLANLFSTFSLFPFLDSCHGLYASISRLLYLFGFILLCFMSFSTSNFLLLYARHIFSIGRQGSDCFTREAFGRE